MFCSELKIVWCSLEAGGRVRGLLPRSKEGQYTLHNAAWDEIICEKACSAVMSSRSDRHHPHSWRARQQSSPHQSYQLLLRRYYFYRYYEHDNNIIGVLTVGCPVQTRKKKKCGDRTRVTLIKLWQTGTAITTTTTTTITIAYYVLRNKILYYDITLSISIVESRPRCTSSKQQRLS